MRLEYIKSFLVLCLMNTPDTSSFVLQVLNVRFISYHTDTFQIKVYSSFLVVLLKCEATNADSLYSLLSVVSYWVSVLATCYKYVTIENNTFRHFF